MPLITPLGKSSPFVGCDDSLPLRRLSCLVKGGARFAMHLPSGLRRLLRRLASDAGLAKKNIHNLYLRSNYLGIGLIKFFPAARFECSVGLMQHFFSAEI